MPFLNKSTLTYPSTNVFPNGIWEDTRDPTTADFRNFFIGTIWINFVAQRAWFMVDRTATSGTWVMAASSGTGILTITGDVGGAVGPDGANNINLLSGGNLTVTGNPGTNTLTITLDGSVADQYTTDAGVAIPAAGNLNVLGAGGITTSGAGSTVTITAGATIPTSFVTDAGAATPAANILNVLGGTLCSTTGAGNTVTINVDATVASQYTTDSGVAVPAANNLNVFGGGGTSTSGAGSTITINSTGGGLSWTEVTVVGPTQMVNNNGYVANNAAPVLLLLPLTSAFGTIIRIVGKGAGGWQITQNAGQSIILDTFATTVGVAGTLTSTAKNDSVELLCTTANTVYTIIDGSGNYIFA